MKPGRPKLNSPVKQILDFITWKDGREHMKPMLCLIPSEREQQYCRESYIRDCCIRCFEDDK